MLNREVDPTVDDYAETLIKPSLKISTMDRNSYHSVELTFLDGANTNTKKDLRASRTSTLTTSYLEVRAFPSPSDAAVGLEQGFIQYMCDVYIDVLATRHTKAPIRFVEKEEGVTNT
ncbi:unnamed protein product [Clonostachys rhizophaga]|uniref:Uncharacterized protein n=1 Tax=Clonostachys rhizophaga TaxID=160324 RepID=A0A9N9V8S8_9HYPO|nr:unnamed protein product [Clonostachys rhizophaga]